jgi:hypothetical protein
MYWYRAETQSGGRWVFFRLFAVSPYDGDMFVATTADRERAQRGYQPVGGRRGRTASSTSSR